MRLSRECLALSREYSSRESRPRNILIRPARPEDAGALTAILWDTFGGTWWPQLTDEAKAMVERDERPSDSPAASGRVVLAFASMARGMRAQWPISRHQVRPRLTLGRLSSVVLARGVADASGVRERAGRATAHGRRRYPLVGA